jgi:hypothetical protein
MASIKKLAYSNADFGIRSAESKANNSSTHSAKGKA